MGSKKSASSGSSGSIGSSINKAKNNVEFKSKIQGEKADQFARQAVGLTETKDGYMGTTYDSAQGKSFKSGNQMYGATYNEARGRYLASQGLATAREVTDALGNVRTVYDPKNADGTYTDMSRMSALEARANKTPLSKEMYDSQQKFKAGIGVVAGFMGAPLIPSLMFKSAATPYSTYVNQTREQGFYNFSTTQTSPIDDVKNVMSKVKEEFADKTKSQKQQKYLANSGMTSTDKGRNLLNTTGSTFSK